MFIVEKNDISSSKSPISCVLHCLPTTHQTYPMCNVAESCSWISHFVTQHGPQQVLEYQLGTRGMLIYFSMGHKIRKIGVGC